MDRHGRPGQVLTVLCAEPVHRAVAAVIFAHTGTLGVRLSRMNRDKVIAAALSGLAAGSVTPIGRAGGKTARRKRQAG